MGGVNEIGGKLLTGGARGRNSGWRVGLAVAAAGMVPGRAVSLFRYSRS